MFRNVSLLLLILAVLAASLALAGPRWLTASSEHQNIVLVLDVSASMQAKLRPGSGAGSTTRMDAAKTIALQLLDGLPHGGRALIMSSARKAMLQSGLGPKNK